MNDRLSRSWWRRASTTLVVTAAALLVLPAGTAHAADEAKISHVEVGDDGTVQVLVSVPPGVEVDLNGVTASVADVDAEATASPSDTQTAIERTTILAIDTSRSMAGDRFAAAKEAASTFLETAPADVQVGIVTFASDVEAALPPTTDRAAAKDVIDGLTLTKQTRLYDGVLEAITQAGDSGARTVLVLSDGADTSKTPLTDVTTAIESADVTVDAVSLDKGGDLASLKAMATAGSGKVIESDPEALREAFSSEAEALSRQILVSLRVPDTVQSQQGTVEVTLPTVDGDTLQASAFGTVRTASNPAPSLAAPGGWALPKWLLLPAAAAGALGLLGILLLVLVPRKVSTAPGDVVDRYTRAAAGKRAAEKKESEVALVQANLALEHLLTRNKSLEERIATRLEQAGSKLKPSEWLLLHLAIFVGATALALLLGRGNIVLTAIAMVAAGVLPWFYLRWKRNARRKKFNALLPDTLQLMAGSLQAGLSLAQSIDTIVREGNEPVAGEFKRVLVETRLGVDLEDAMEGITERFDSKDFGWVVMAIKIQRQVGGNLAELLTTVAATMREREYIRRQVTALAAEGKLSAWVLGLLPPIFLLYLVLVNRDYVWPLFTNPVGWAMLALGSVILAVGTFWMSRIVKVEV